jgi:hypothetical protein
VRHVIKSHASYILPVTPIPMGEAPHGTSDPRDPAKTANCTITTTLLLKRMPRNASERTHARWPSVWASLSAGIHAGGGGRTPLAAGGASAGGTAIIKPPKGDSGSDISFLKISFSFKIIQSLQFEQIGDFAKIL